MIKENKNLQAAASVTSALQVSNWFDHLGLLQTDSESIRIFLRKFHQYANEVLSSTKQLVVGLATNTLTTNSVRPVQMKFLGDVKFLESSIALRFMTDAVK